MAEWVRVGRGGEYWLEVAGYRAMVAEVADGCWLWTVVAPSSQPGGPGRLDGESDSRRAAQAAVIQALYGCGLSPRDLGPAAAIG